MREILLDWASRARHALCSFESYGPKPEVQNFRLDTSERPAGVAASLTWTHVAGLRRLGGHRVEREQRRLGAGWKHNAAHRSRYGRHLFVCRWRCSGCLPFVGGHGANGWHWARGALFESSRLGQRPHRVFERSRPSQPGDRVWGRGSGLWWGRRWRRGSRGGRGWRRAPVQRLPDGLRLRRLGSRLLLQQRPQR